MIDKKEITTAAFRLLPNYRELSKEKELTPETIELVADRIRRIQAGLGPEMEFMAAVNWLSNVACIHRLDQTPLPKCCEGEDMQQPDLLAIIHHKGKTLPVLIEVKTKNDGKLNWKEEYLRKLQRYAEAVHMPLLIAWKRWNIWTLFEAKHFTKKISAYHISFDRAMSETLMGVLFGDSFINISTRLRFIVDANVAEPLPVTADNLMPTGRFTLTITKAGFSFDDKQIALPKELFWAFNAAECREEVTRIAEQSVRLEYVPIESSLYSLTHLWHMLATPDEEDVNLDWEEIMRKPLRIQAKMLQRELRDGHPKIARVMDVQPNTMPGFLKK